jgi:ABC-2 type transport system ATP-binding protein
MNENNTLNEKPIILKVDGLKKSYGSTEVLKGIDLTIRQGEVFGLLGKNGVGKSTTIDCVVGLKKFKEGQITILGHDVQKEPLLCKSKIGYVPSEPTAYEFMTGYEYLAFVASCFHMSQRDYVDNVAYLRDRLDFTNEDLAKRIGDYSHGMKQKVCLMASLIHNPTLWILDEPSVGLDVMVYESLKKMIREFADSGHAVLLTSHNIEMVGKLADEAAILYQGKVSTLIDFRKEPFKRNDLSAIFFRLYGEDEK